jgi:methionyl-tRNA synthetase
MRAVFACNQYVDEQAPWGLKKTDPDRMTAVLMTLFIVVRDLAIAIRPVVPTAADNLLDQMGIREDERGIWRRWPIRNGFRSSSIAALCSASRPRCSRASNCPKGKGRPDARRFALPSQL